MYKRIIPLLFLSAIFSCHKKVPMHKGTIDVFSNVYINASKGLSEVQSYHVSQLNFSGDSIVELIPSEDQPGNFSHAYFITDSTYAKIGPKDLIPQTILSQLKGRALLKDKPDGAIFTGEHLPNLAYRQEISDTVLFGKKYKRFEIVSKEFFTRYYVHPTDTILPYTVYGEIWPYYHGRIERIDSYNREKDIFVTLQMFLHTTLDKDVQAMFDYNNFLKNHQ